ncbi:hypothetical protein MNBD_GAMMA12-3770 [hydrothermal vent metagenome]|uniref:Uncharacterized protein n=1 Tax=hydrothermal vent metagenome TaxID=652676 RepID=A0A3B0YCG5_9ZZZZ
MLRSINFHKLLTVFVLAVMSISRLQAAEVRFFSGSNLENKDSKSYDIHYSYSARTKVCFVLKPTPEIKRGLLTTLSREAEGLTVINRKFDGENATINAKIAAKSRVYCLCADDCEITVGSLGKKIVGNGKTLVIENGALSIK